MTEHEQESIRTDGGRWALAAAVSAVAALGLTLWPNPAASAAIAETPWWCIVCGAHGGADLFQNILLLLPLGLCLGRAGWPRGWVLPLVVALPVAIEVAQGLAIPGRDAALGDVLANAAGATLGYMIGRRVHGGRSGGTLVAGGVLAVFALQLVASQWLLAMAVRGPAPWAQYLTPSDPGRPTYAGEVLDAPEPGARTVSWRATWAPPSDGVLAPIARLEDANGQVLTALDRRGGQVGIEVRIHGALLRLRNPAWLLSVPGGIADGDTITVALRRDPGTVRLTTNTGRDSTLRVVRVGSQHGWALINPFAPAHRSDAAWQRWTVAWLVGWGLLLGWAARHARRPAWWGAGALAVLLLGTAWSHTLASGPELLALLAGWLAGWRISSGR